MPAEMALRIPPHPEMVLGPGALGELSNLVGRLGMDAAFVVTDRGLVAAGVSAKVIAHLQAAGVRTEVYDGVGANPCEREVLGGSAALRTFGRSAVVAVGGGSPMDAAKAIALHAANDRPLEELAALGPSLAPAAPLIGIPTTAGTGSETNGFGVIDDPVGRRKRYVGHPSALPCFALLDPDLSVTAPPPVTAACGIDVLAHAIESVQARGANVYSAGLALEAIRLVVAHLPAVVADGRDMAGRSAMLLAAHLAGLAFATTGLGTAHAIGHALSARYGTAHGIALAAVLPAVAELNARERRAETERIAEAAGVTGGRGEVPRALSALQRGVGLCQTLRDLGVPRSDLPAIADAALADVVVRNAPRVPTRGELLHLLDATY